ncbi:MAG: YeaH/YhbH family protein [Ectothiorhodospiraceae bacterium]|nr:YeaH/YhbH family protein [Ectothiorhodospiraceae bacterium]
MSQIIDRRLNGKNKSAVNRQRFLRRYKAQIRKAASAAVSGRSITDATSGEKVNIPTRDIAEPTFHHGAGGRRETVHPGNTDFVAGDRIARPKGGGGGGSGRGDPSRDGTGEDEFVFELTRDEFLDCFFEDLELPNLVQREIKEMLSHRTVRAGYSRQGVPANINVVRTLRGALGRRIALRGPYRERLREVERELEELEDQGLGSSARAIELREEIRRLRTHIEAIPFIDDFDLRYNHRIRVPQPSTQAVMFCLMDVSGSMDEARKDIAKRFFILLYLFLLRSYERIDVVFVRHHVTAKEVDEHEFFYARETGGTVVSSALKLMDEIVRDRYPLSSWNIYAAQASDGENWGDDSTTCRELLTERILPLVQYYAYVEITPDRHQSLWAEYEAVAAEHEHFAMQEIASPADIFPVFRRLLARKPA